MRTRISNSHRVHALPSRDFRISFRCVRIPGANEERSGTLAAARRKKKEAPRPRYVAGTQTGVLVPTSLCIHLRERAGACARVLRVCKYSLFLPSPLCRSPLFPTILVPRIPSDPRGSPSCISCIPAARTLPRPQIEASERKRDAWPHLDPHRFSFPPLPIALSLLLI